MTEASQTNIGFVGLGRMGAPMAFRLLEAGYALTVYDTQEAVVQSLAAKGATRAASPREVADQAAIVLMSLPMPAIVKEVALGEQGVVHGGAVKTVIDLSTTGRTVSLEVAEGLRAKGVELIDCPVSGGVAGATAGTLALMASGNPQHYDTVNPVLSKLGRLIYVGEQAGMAQTMKVINNLISVTSLAITGEAMVMGAKSGLDADKMIEVFNAGSGRTSASADKIPKFVLPGTFDFGFALGLSVKDVGLCLDEARALGLPMDVGSAAQRVLGLAREAYGPTADLTEIVRYQEEQADVVVRGAAAKKK